MANALQRTLRNRLYSLGPFALTVFFIIFSRVPFQSGDSGMFIPIFSLIYTYYFRLHFPQTLRLWVIFLIGILEDYISGGILGLTPLILLMISALFERYRKIFLQGSFTTDCILFAFFSLGISLLYWLLTSFVEAQFFPVLPFFVQGAITALAFPIYVVVIGRLYHKFAR